MYALIMMFRNWLFDKGLLAQYRADAKVISVGNLSMGGTGKTPMCSYILSELLSEGYLPTLLTRGYGRKTRGLVEATETSKVQNIGDEAYMLHKRFGEKIRVVACANRTKAAKHVLSSKRNTTHIILDDAFQHRYIKRDLDILLTTYQKPYYNDHVLPWGTLREPRQGAQRAQIIVVTKCPPQLSLTEAEEIRKQLDVKNTTHVFYTSISYENKPTGPVNLVTGIAQPDPLLDEIDVKAHLRYSDHHNFTTDDIQKIESLEGDIYTTEKDYVRMPTHLQQRIKPIKIKIEFLFNQRHNFNTLLP